LQTKEFLEEKTGRGGPPCEEKGKSDRWQTSRKVAAKILGRRGENVYTLGILKNLDCKTRERLRW